MNCPRCGAENSVGPACSDPEYWQGDLLCHVCYELICMEEDYPLLFTGSSNDTSWYRIEVTA